MLDFGYFTLISSLKITSLKLASSLLVTLGILSFHAPLTCAAEVQATTEQGVAPVEPAKANVPIQAPASALFTILAHTNHPGWDPVEFKPFRIAGTRLEALELPPGVAKVEAVEGVMLTLPLAISYLLPLSESRCKLIVQKTVKRGNRYITIKAFEFDNSEGQSPGMTCSERALPLSFNAEMVHPMMATAFHFGKTIFSLSFQGSSLDDDESKEVVGLFATNIAKSIITHAQPPAILSKIPVVERVRGSEKVVMGPVSAARVISTPEVAALFGEKIRSAVVADYQVFIPARERMRVLYIDYGNGQSAQAALNAFVERLEQLLSPEKGWPQDGRVLFRMSKSYVYCQARTSGKLLLITGAKKNKSAILLAGQFVDR